MFLKNSQVSQANTCVGVSFDRSSHWRCSVEEVFLKIFQISQETTCVGVSLIEFVKNFINKRLQHRCFHVKFEKFLRTPYFEEQLQTTASVLNIEAGSKVCNFIKKRLQHRCFPVKFAKFLRTPISKNICFICSKNIYERLLLSIDLFAKGCIFCETSLYCIRLG